MAYKRASSSADTRQISRELLEALLARKAGVIDGDEPISTLAVCPRCVGATRLTEVVMRDGRHQATSEERCFLCDGDGTTTFEIAGAYARSLLPR